MSNLSQFKLSLIIATYGRDKEVDDLLLSLTLQDCSKNDFEVIIVDQNDKIDLSLIINKYNLVLNLNHIKSNVKGLSISKNKGIKAAKAPIITFPDDDCTFYSNTISSALSYLEHHSNVDIVYGRLYDRKSQENIMRVWSSEDKVLNKLNFHTNYSAVTCFSKSKELLFDEMYGVGAKYGSGEELDYIMQALNNEMTVHYSPTIDIWHPPLNVLVMSKEKVYLYGYGYGKIFRKNFNWIFFSIFISAIAYQLLDLLKGCLMFDKNLVVKRATSLKARIHGFLNL